MSILAQFLKSKPSMEKHDISINVFLLKTIVKRDWLLNLKKILREDDCKPQILYPPKLSIQLG